ncbi:MULTISPECIES: hypothetical protein [Methylomicrobium]|uniref:Uncharacterized protein n=1 Tax=Methylomicrobium album BG8 TaxID=686340 RepID=H8GGH9_METAL|nr:MULTISPECIES: hypothetical protein [Methylomicrobium]EIC28775.1 hypothetical protein Metal_0956 [Methylomicrobium album BG8]
MARYANIYDICDTPILKEQPYAEPGRNLKRLYRKVAGNGLLKYLILKGCRHPEIPMQAVPAYQAVIRAAMRAGYDEWRDAGWIDRTFKPIAELLDRIDPPHFRRREKTPLIQTNPKPEALDTVIERCLQDILQTWNSHHENPYFPVAAQVVLSGDDQMNGENFLNILRGVGAFEYRNAVLLFALIRCFIHCNPVKLKVVRKPYRGIAEKLFQRSHWFIHRTAFYDVNFFELLLTRVAKNRLTPDELQPIVQILENLLHFCVVTSQEWLVTPNNGIRHPATTCFPEDERAECLFKLNQKNRAIKKDLGFGNYAPDTDTTFFTLSIAKKWLDLVEEKHLAADVKLLRECRNFLAHPWVEIITEYQIGSGYTSNPPTIRMTRPLDYQGAIPIWFDKRFRKSDGRIVREPAGNEICPGHNMDILEAMLVNRKQWRSLEGDNLKTVRRLLDFHYRTVASGNFRHESVFQYYLPEIYVYYIGRFYEAYLTLGDAEKNSLNPEGQVEKIRRIALDYCKSELIGYTLNAFDAAIAVAALALLRHEPRDDGLIATGLKTMSDALGEGAKGHLFQPYEWTRLRHPCRIIVGSEVATSLFVMSAFASAKQYLYGNG